MPNPVQFNWGLGTELLQNKYTELFSGVRMRYSEGIHTLYAKGQRVPFVQCVSLVRTWVRRRPEDPAAGDVALLVPLALLYALARVLAYPGRRH